MEEEKTNNEEEVTTEIPVEEETEIPVEEETDQAEEEAEGQEQTTEKPDPLEAANRQIEELKDKYLRQVAEFDNYRKRTLKERAELILNGGEKTITALLPVVDDMERALDNGEKTEDPEVLREGMKLIYQKMMKLLEGLGVKVIDTEDADFDTDVHEAIAMVPGMGDDKKGKVVGCTQKGYKLNDKVIRHAQVAVGQ